MLVSKKYLHDKFVLLLVSVNIFLAFLSTILVLLRLGTGLSSEGYIVQYRSNLGIGAFKAGNVTELLSFIGYVIVVCTLNIILSIKTYDLRRQLSITILSLGALLLLLALIVSNALLVLR